MTEQYPIYSFFMDRDGNKYTDEEWYEKIKHDSGEAIAKSTFALLRKSLRETHHKILEEMNNGSH